MGSYSPNVLEGGNPEIAVSLQNLNGPFVDRGRGLGQDANVYDGYNVAIGVLVLVVVLLLAAVLFIAFVVFHR